MNRKKEVNSLMISITLSTFIPLANGDTNIVKTFKLNCKYVKNYEKKIRPELLVWIAINKQENVDSDLQFQESVKLIEILLLDILCIFKSEF